jgi:hypothetical protein
MVADAINERMARRIDYLLEQVRVLREVYRETTGRKRILFTDERRRRLAIKAKALTPDEREGCCQIVRPNTLLDWFRQLVAKKYDSSMRRKKPGRGKALRVRLLCGRNLRDVRYCSCDSLLRDRTAHTRRAHRSYAVQHFRARAVHLHPMISL